MGRDWDLNLWKNLEVLHFFCQKRALRITRFEAFHDLSLAVGSIDGRQEIFIWGLLDRPEKGDPFFEKYPKKCDINSRFAPVNIASNAKNSIVVLENGGLYINQVRDD